MQPTGHEHGPATTPWMPPAAFDDYVIDRPLGRGGMGRVFLGRDIRLDRAVALKFIAATTPAAEAVQRFVVEARAIARLSHVNVAAIYRLGDVEGRPYIAYEYVDGPSLDWVQRPATWADTARILADVASGLAAAAAAGIVHRDVKPANVVLNSAGQAKLLDFGLAELLDGRRGGSLGRRPSGDAPRKSPTETSGGVSLAETAELATTRGVQASAPHDLSIAVTQDVQRGARSDAAVSAIWTAAALPALSDSDPSRGRAGIVGTPLYLPPEAWLGATPTAAGDVWSLGLVAWTLLAGHHPFPQDDLVELQAAVTSTPVPSLLDVVNDVPSSLSMLIGRCLSQDPASRPSAAEIAERARAIVPGGGTLRVKPRRLGSEDALHVTDALARLEDGGIERVSAGIYARLFELRPDLRRLFPNEMTAMEQKLAETLELAVSNLSRPERLEPFLVALGGRHVDYGVKDRDYGDLAVAILGALAELDADHWSPTLERAWARAFEELARVMTRRDASRP